MALVQISNVEYVGDIDDLPPLSAPMPKEAKFYADFKRGLYISESEGIIKKSLHPDSVINFSRKTGASYINGDGSLSYYGLNTLRIDRDPDDHKVLGARIENRMTQLCENPTDQLAVSYVATGVSVESTASVWFSLTESTANEPHFILDTSSKIATTGQSTVSIHAKAGSARYLQISINGNGKNQVYANFDLLDGSVKKTGTQTAGAKISKGFDNSWRCELTSNSIGTSAAEISYAIVNSANAEAKSAHTGAGEKLYISTAQSETGSFASSPYSPPSGATIRDMEDLRFVPDVVGGDSFSLFISGITAPTEQGPAGGNQILTVMTGGKYISFGFGSTSGSFALRSVCTSNLTGVGVGTSYTGPTFSPYREYSLMITVEQGNVKVFTGMTSAPETVLTGVAAIDTILLGRGTSSVGTGGAWGGWVKKVVYFPSAIPDTKMIQIFEDLV